MQDNDQCRAKRLAAGEPSSDDKVTELRAGTARLETVSLPPRIESRTLFRGGREAIILHDGAEYRLRLTASGKLILTK